jgi:hypothetical protein
MPKASYEGLSWKELKAVATQGIKNLKSRRGLRCELGHDDGCTTEPSQDGKAPCLAEVMNEVRWRNANATVE